MMRPLDASSDIYAGRLNGKDAAKPLSRWNHHKSVFIYWDRYKFHAESEKE